jgi:hypothetical protein
MRTEKKCKKSAPPKMNNLYHHLCLTTIYFPHSGYKETELDQFNADISTCLANILAKRNTTHIIGADTNSSIGTRNSQTDTSSQPCKHESALDIDPINQHLARDPTCTNQKEMPLPT